jgi:hypothetical protein
LRLLIAAITFTFFLLVGSAWLSMDVWIEFSRVCVHFRELFYVVALQVETKNLSFDANLLNLTTGIQETTEYVGYI